MRNSTDAAAVRVFPPAVPLAAILLGVVLQRLLPIDPGFTPGTAVRQAVGLGLVFGSLLGLGLWSVWLMRGTGQSENPWKPTTEIVERGPYRISRNPMYLQMVLIVVGFSVLLWNGWVLLSTPFCAWALQRWVIVPEEEYLEEKFGESYLAYKRRVGRWL